MGSSDSSTPHREEGCVEVWLWKAWWAFIGGSDDEWCVAR